MRLARATTLFVSASLLLALVPAARAATIEVNSSADNLMNDQACTLREAVQSANTNADPNPADGVDCEDGEMADDLIELDGIPYVRTAGGSDDTNQLGDLDVNVSAAAGDLEISGAGMLSTTIDAFDLDRVIEVPEGLAGGSLTLSDLTVTNGTATPGGGIAINDFDDPTDLTLNSVALTANSAAFAGGIYFEGGGALALNSSSVTGNTVSASSTGAIAAGIRTEPGGTLDMFESKVSNNIVNSSSPGSASAVLGAGIQLNATNTTITRSTVSGNQINMTNGGSDDLPQGAGIHTTDSNLTIVESTISGNSTSGGSAGSGGGLFYDDPTTPSADNLLTILNSTFSGNNSGVGGGGGGLKFAGGVGTITHATFSQNTSPDGDGINLTRPLGQNAALTLRGTLLVEPGADECSLPDIPLTSIGRNLDQGTSCGMGGAPNNNIQGAAPLIFGLGDFGGPTQTHNILSGPGVNFIPAVECNTTNGTHPIATDQRGVPRSDLALGNTACDVGAFEIGECEGRLINVVGTDGPDTLDGTGAEDGILARGGDDVIDSSPRDDVICGGTGNDTFVQTTDPFGNVDSLEGQAGADTISLEDLATDDNSALVGSGTGLVQAGALGPTLAFLTGIENATGSAQDDTLLGRATEMAGQSFSNVLKGGAGDDTLEGRGGDDVLQGEGNTAAGDTVVYDEAPAGVTVDLALGTPQNTGDGTDTIATTENAVGSTFADTLKGTTGANVLTGGAGSDTVDYSAGVGVTVDLDGGSATNQGNDSLPSIENVIGSDTGADAVTGGTDDNDFSGGPSAGDTFRFDGVGPPQAVVVNMAAGIATGQAVTEDTFDGVEGLIGSVEDDTLIGDGGANQIAGNLGGDSITGGGGIDMVFGDPGADSLFVRDSLGDTADCGAGDGAMDTVEADLLGTDVVNNCEGGDVVLFDVPAATTPPGTGSTPGTVTPVATKCRKGFKLKTVKTKSGKKKKRCVRKKKRR